MNRKNLKLINLLHILKSTGNDKKFNVWIEFRKEYKNRYGIELGRKDEMFPMNENVKELQSLASTFYYGRGIADLVKQAFFNNLIKEDECARLLKLSIEEVQKLINLWKFDSYIL